MDTGAHQRGTGRHYYVSRRADILGLDDQELVRRFHGTTPIALGV